MLLAIDAGNTKTKWAVFDAQNQLLLQQASLNSEIEATDFPPQQFAVTQAMVANVAGAEHLKLIEQKLKQHAIRYQIADVQPFACGILNGYQSPKNLGVDRWAAIIAAFHLNHQSCLVVNAGTAITVDALVVTPNEAKFLGGTISPGLRLMQLSLRQNTAQLNAEGGNVQSFPVNTDDAIYSGCVHAAVGAIDAQWQHLQKLVKIPPKLVLSGGDAAVIAKNLPDYLLKHHNIVDNLVLVGLMRLGREKA
jgi:type III pantothenate kinase